MTLKNLVWLMIATIISSCGLTPIQKQQVGQFASSTQSISMSTQNQFKSTRDKVIELERRRLIMRKKAPPEKFDLDGGLSATGIATQIATLKALQSYGDVLEKLASNDQSEAISKAANEFLTQYENAEKLRETSFVLDQDKKEALVGAVNIVSSWFIEKEKKKYLKKIVIAYAPAITNLANHLINDLTLDQDSLCADKSQKNTFSSATGVIDIYCTSADGVKSLSEDVLQNKDYSFAEREFAYDSFVLSEQAIEEITTLSGQGEKVVTSLKQANSQLLKVIESDKYSADDIKIYAQQVQELRTLTNVLNGR